MQERYYDYMLRRTREENKKMNDGIWHLIVGTFPFAFQSYSQPNPIICHPSDHFGVFMQFSF